MTFSESMGGIETIESEFVRDSLKSKDRESMEVIVNRSLLDALQKEKAVLQFQKLTSRGQIEGFFNQKQKQGKEAEIGVVKLYLKWKWFYEWKIDGKVDVKLVDAAVEWLSCKGEVSASEVKEWQSGLLQNVQSLLHEVMYEEFNQEYRMYSKSVESVIKENSDLVANQKFLLFFEKYLKNWQATNYGLFETEKISDCITKLYNIVQKIPDVYDNPGISDLMSDSDKVDQTYKVFKKFWDKINEGNSVKIIEYIAYWVSDKMIENMPTNIDDVVNLFEYANKVDDIFVNPPVKFKENKGVIYAWLEKFIFKDNIIFNYIVEKKLDINDIITLYAIYEGKDYMLNDDLILSLYEKLWLIDTWFNGPEICTKNIQIS